MHDYWRHNFTQDIRTALRQELDVFQKKAEQNELALLRISARLQVAATSLIASSSPQLAEHVQAMVFEMNSILAGSIAQAQGPDHTVFVISEAVDEVAKKLEDGLEGLIERYRSKLASVQPPTVHRPHDASVRREVHQMTDGRCCYCNVEVAFEDMELEHIVPKSAGGPDHINNYVPSCRPCNQLKRDKHPVHFIRQKLGLNVVRFNPNLEAAE